MTMPHSAPPDLIGTGFDRQFAQCQDDDGSTIPDADRIGRWNGARMARIFLASSDRAEAMLGAQAVAVPVAAMACLRPAMPHDLADTTRHHPRSRAVTKRCIQVVALRQRDRLRDPRPRSNSENRTMLPHAR